MDYKFSKNRWKYRSQSEIPGTLTLHDESTGQPLTLDRLPVNQARKQLGILSPVNGDMTAEVKYLRKKAEAWATIVREKQCNKEDMWYTMNSTIMKTIQYPLMATTMSKAQLRTVMAPILTEGLHKIRQQKNMPRALVYGPKKYQGNGIEKILARVRSATTSKFHPAFHIGSGELKKMSAVVILFLLGRV